MDKASLDLQLKILEYMEKTYGKDYEKKNINHAGIHNAFIEGYQTKAKENKDAQELCVSKKVALEIHEGLEKIFEKVDNEFPFVGKLLGIKIVGKDCVPDNVGVLVDGSGNVLSFINFK